MNIPKMTVDLGEYGTQEIDFSSLVRVTSDLNKELVEGASAYAYIDFVEKELKRQYEEKKLVLDEVHAKRREDLAEEIMEEKGKKPTVADLDSALAKDATIIKMKQEMQHISYMTDRVRGFSSALSQKHSNVKMLSQRELAGLGMDNNEVEEPTKIERKPRVKRGRSAK